MLFNQISSCFKEANIFNSMRIIELLISSILTLLVAWFIWTLQRKYYDKKELEKQRQEYIMNLRSIVNDLKIGFRNQLVIAICGHHYKEAFQSHWINIDLRINRILTISKIKINEKLVSRLRLFHDHYSDMNNLVRRYLDLKSEAIIDLPVRSRERKAKWLGQSIVIQSKWDIDNTLETIHQLMDELRKFGDLKLGDINKQYYQEVFNQIIVEIKKIEFFEIHNLDVFNKHIGFEFKLDE